MDYSREIITCGIIDDETDARILLEKLLCKIKGIKIVFNEGRSEKALEKILSLKPDIIFVDIEMPGLNGFDLIKKAGEKLPNLVFIFVTAFNHYAIKAIKREAFDYILKPVDLEELTNTINRYRKKQNHHSIKSHPKYNTLSSREKEILELVIEGLTSQDISKKLFITKTTVDTHRHNILSKLSYKSIRELLSDISSY